MNKTQLQRATRVKDLMTREVCACTGNSTLADVARIMWEHDCGAVPVVDEMGSARVVGMVTDRDIAMGAYIQGKPLQDMHVRDVMARGPTTCAPNDDIERAAQRMADRQVRRLPVTDDDGRLVGLLSLAQLARACDNGNGTRTTRDDGPARVVHTLSSISTPRQESSESA